MNSTSASYIIYLTALEAALIKAAIVEIKSTGDIIDIKLLLARPQSHQRSNDGTIKRLLREGT